MGTLEEGIKGEYTHSHLHYSQLTMASDNCALGTDGKLLDASQIRWFNDPDDDEPMASASTSSTTQRPMAQVATMLDSFITNVPPAAWRSTRAPRPSTKAIDPNNVMNLKRKPSSSATRKPCHPRLTSPLHEEDDAIASEPDPTNTEDNNPINPDIAYEETKALGDTDREVSLSPASPMLLFNCLQRPCMQVIT